MHLIDLVRRSFEWRTFVVMFGVAATCPSLGIRVMPLTPCGASFAAVHLRAHVDDDNLEGAASALPGLGEKSAERKELNQTSGS